MHPAHSTRRCFVLLTCLLAPGCGFGTAAVASATSGNGGATNAQAVLSNPSAPRSATSPASIFFDLVDQERDPADVDILFRQGGTGEFKPITLAAGSPKLTRVPTPVSSYRVAWDFATDLGGEGFHDKIELMFIARDGISPAALGDVTQGNDAPVAMTARPLPLGLGKYGGNTDIEVTVADTAADRVDIKVEYNDDAAGGFPDSNWKIARPAATPAAQTPPEFAIAGLTAAPTGSTVTFRWDTLADLPGFDADVRLRFTPQDEFGSGGTAGTLTLTPSFRVDNNQPPLAVVENDSVALGVKRRGNIPIPYRLIDAESDTLRVVVQWRAPGEEFPSLPATVTDVLDVLDNPERAVEREQLHIATEAPVAFTGRLGTLTAGLVANQVRLPELAGSQAGLRAYGIAGGTLEILRPTALLQPIDWTPNPLSGPVAALPSANGLTALVLDAATVGWRLREIDLETGVVVRQIGTGGGTPRALCRDAAGTRLFVGSSTGVFRFQAGTGAALGFVAHAFADGPRGLAAIGANVVLATGDDKLTRVDFAALTNATLIHGLSEPWGVAVDPVDPGSLYLAERTANRVAAVRLDQLVPRRLVVSVDPADVASLGSVPFPSPAAIALENDGRRLLVMTRSGTTASLRSLDLRNTTDFDGAADGRADSFVRQIVARAGEVGTAIATGADHLRLAIFTNTGTSTGRVHASGGIAQARTIVGAPANAADPLPYAPANQVVTLTAPLAAGLAADAPWRIRTPARGDADPAGVRHVFVWDTAQVRATRDVIVRVVPLDADVGTPLVGAQSVRLDSLFSVQQFFSTVIPTAPTTLVTDLDGDGDMDVVSGARLLTQTAPGTFSLNGSIPTKVVAAADLNGDGAVDLLTTSSILLQTTPGTFTAGPSIAGVAAADVDGDGDMDVVRSLGISLQTSPGVFTAGPTWTTPSVTVAADLDGDGDVDLAGGDRILRQTAPGVFTLSPALLPVNGTLLLAADLDGDGDTDLVSRSSTSSGTLNILLQTAPGAFSLASTVAAAGGVAQVAGGDLDRDGDVDLALAFSGSNFVQVWIQTSPGSFEPAADLLVAPNLGDIAVNTSVAIGDVDGDGNPDVAYGNDSTENGSSLTLFLQSAPVFTAGATAMSAPPGLGASGITMGDLDGDGDLDLAATNVFPPSFVNTTVTTAFQAVPGRFDPGQSYSRTLANPSTLAAYDIDGDGDLDLACASPSFSAGVFVFTLLQSQPGLFGFGPATLPSGTGGSLFTDWDVVARDLDGDGDADFVVAGAGLDVCVQSPSGSFAVTEVLAGAGRGVAVGDFDGDGDLDLVASSAAGNSLVLLRQGPAGTFTNVGTLPLASGAAPHSLALADVNGDGKVDIVSANAGASTMTVFRQTTPGAFVSAGTFAVGGSARGLGVADLDQDGDLDLVVGGKVLRQIAPGVFRATDTIGGGSGTLGAIGDLDGDGDPDLIYVGGAPFFGGR